MAMMISGAPCSWGVDDPQNPYLPAWTLVLNEAHLAGYQGIELGPYGYLPIDLELVSKELAKNELNIIAGTIFDDLVNPDNLDALKKQAHDICRLITELPQPDYDQAIRFKPPYLVIIDWGHDERDYAAGHPDRAPRLKDEDWNRMIEHIEELSAIATKYGVRPVIHPHAGGYIEFADEIDRLAKDISAEKAGLCLDTGHLKYSKMEPKEWLEKYYNRLDYIHFKDIDEAVYEKVMHQKIRFFDACAIGVMCPIGQGNIDYPEILNLLSKLGYNGYITIEQERDPRNSGGSLAAVKQSIDYLKKIGF